MFKHNDKVTCSIGGTKITDARISIDKDGRPFICQNERDGTDAENKLGYKYSWVIDTDFTNRDVTDLRRVEITWDNLQYGDQLKDSDGNERTVLVAHPNSVYSVSNTSDQSISDFTYTAQSLQDKGYTIVQEEVKPIRTVTQEEVCKMFGENVIIK